MFLNRSWLFVPGNHVRHLEKAKELPADVIIYDLEDAVPLSEKDRARKMVLEAINKNKEKIQFIRINDSMSPYFLDDVTETVGPYVAGIILPKVSGRDQIIFVDQLITQLEEKKGISKGTIRIVPLIESALGLYHAYEIAISSSRVRKLAFGSVDYTLDIGAQLTKQGQEILFARSQLVVVSRAAGIESPIDAVYMDVKDTEGFLQDTRLAKQLGFSSKLVIHPDQIIAANQVFSPTEEEIEEAQLIVSAFDQAVNTGSAAIQVNGRLVDYPVASRCRKVLGQARLLGFID